jgi:hypothetical protein
MASLRVAILKRRIQSLIARVTLRLAMLAAIPVALGFLGVFRQWNISPLELAVAAAIIIVGLDASLLGLGIWSISKTKQVEALWQKRWADISRLSGAISWEKEAPASKEEAMRLWNQIPFDPAFTFVDPLASYQGEVFHGPASVAPEALLSACAATMAQQCRRFSLKEFVVFRAKVNERDLIFMRVYVPYEGTWKGYVTFRIGVDIVGAIAHFNLQRSLSYRVTKPWKEALHKPRPLTIRDDAYYTKWLFAKTELHGLERYLPMRTMGLTFTPGRFFVLAEFVASVFSGWPFWSTHMLEFMPAGLGDDGEDRAIVQMRGHRSAQSTGFLYSKDKIGVNLPDSELGPFYETSAVITGAIREALYDMVARILWSEAKREG